jgi:hypothetical protein
MKLGFRGQRAPIQMRSAKDEWPRPIGQPAWAVSNSGWFEHPGVWATGPQFTIIDTPAVLDTCDAPKNYAESTTQNVAGFSGREIDGFANGECEAQRLQAKQQKTF